jgi:hypothetical protein
MAIVQQRAREAVLGSATALREAELMRDRLREALMEAREHIADATPEETRAKIDAALQAAPMTSEQVGGWPAQQKPSTSSAGRSGSAGARSSGLSRTGG